MFLKQTLVGLCAISMIGCTASIEPAGSASSNELPEAQLAAYAASTKYPDKNASDDMKLGAMVNRDDKSIQLINYTDKTLTDAKVWINQGYLYKVSSIPAHGYATLSTADFYNGSGHALSEMNNPVNRIQVETSDGLFNVQGPVFK